MKPIDDHALNRTPLRRLIPSLYRRISSISKSQFKVKRRYGHQFLLDKTNLIDKSMLYRFGWEGEKFHAFLSHVVNDFPENIVFLDIGSHWGLYAIRMSGLPAFREIHAYEPDRRNLAQLYGNLFLNGLEDRIEVHEFAASDHDGEIPFLMAVTENRGVSRIAHDDGEGVIRTVECKPIDSHLTYKNRHIAAKIDVEGAELSVLYGMTDLLNNNKCILMVEIDRKLLDETIAKLKPLGLELAAELSDSKGETDYLFKNY